MSDFQESNDNWQDAYQSAFREPPAAPAPKKHMFAKGVLTGVFCTVLVLALLVTVLIRQLGLVSNGGQSSSGIGLGDLAGSDREIVTEEVNAKINLLTGLIDSYYYQDVDEETLQTGLYRGLLESLGDPYSEYYTAEEYTELMIDLMGEYSGIGAVLSQSRTTNEVTITEVYRDSPAEKAGLRKGDRILSADGHNALELSLDEFVSYIRGEKGTDVELVILRGDQELTITATRDDINVQSVDWQMPEEGIGYIRISQFITSTYSDFVTALQELQDQGMESLIIDLRGNGGGLLDACVDMLDVMLPEGTVVYTMDKNGNREDFTSDASCLEIPLVLLVDENSASASEIFTGAIRDYEWGTIVGTTTYGKGIVQTTVPLMTGDAIKLTIETYYTPSGEAIHGVGITPDVVLEYEFLGEEDQEYELSLDNQYLKAVEILQEQTQSLDAAAR